MPCPAATCSHQSSTVRAVAPMIGTSPPGRGLMSQSSCQARGSQPSVARSAVTNGSPATSASRSSSRPASGCPAGSTNIRGSDRTTISSIPGAATGGRSSATSLLWSSSPADGCVMSKVCMRTSTSGYARLEGGEQPGPGLVLAAGTEPDRQLPGDRPGRVPRCRHAAVQVSEHLPGRVEEGGAGCRERGAPVRPVQQLAPDSVFQLPDLRAEDLLGDVDAVRGGGKARLLGDRDEVPEMTQLNVHRRTHPNREES